MSEKGPVFESAEKKFQIDGEAGYFRACRFANNPVNYLVELREYLISENFDEEDFATIAIGEVFELEVVIGNEDIPISENRLRDFTLAESEGGDWAINLFSLLKDAGYQKVEIEKYIALDDPEFTHEERLRERGLNVYLNKVYGED